MIESGVSVSLPNGDEIRSEIDNTMILVAQTRIENEDLYSLESIKDKNGQSNDPKEERKKKDSDSQLF